MFYEDSQLEDTSKKDESKTISIASFKTQLLKKKINSMSKLWMSFKYYDICLLSEFHLHLGQFIFIRQMNIECIKPVFHN